MSDHIYRLAVRYLEAHDEYKHHKKERGDSVCDHEAVLRSIEDMCEADPYNGRFLKLPKMIDDYAGPCWKGEYNDSYDGYSGGDYYQNGDEYPGGWCPSCLERQKHHEALPAAAQRKAGRLSALLSATRARMKKEES